MAETYQKGIVQRIIRNLLDIQILRLIDAQPLWGYKIKKKVEADFHIKVRHGALYPMLNRLEQQGFLTSQKQRQGGRTSKDITTYLKSSLKAKATTSFFALPTYLQTA
jgi:DNA-binding PadR family transcriptional regulator